MAAASRVLFFGFFKEKPFSGKAISIPHPVSINAEVE